MESLILKQSPPEQLLKDVSCWRLILGSKHSVCTCTNPLTQSSPLALFRQNWELWLWVPSGGSLPPRKLLLIWTFRGNTLADVCLSCEYRAQTEDEQRQTAGSPVHTGLMVSGREVPGGCSPHATPQARRESQWAAWKQISLPFPPFPQRHLLLRNLNVGSVQTKSVGRGVCQSAAA